MISFSITFLFINAVWWDAVISGWVNAGGHPLVQGIVISQPYHGLMLSTPILVFNALLFLEKRLCFISLSSEESGICFTWEVNGEKYNFP